MAAYREATEASSTADAATAVVVSGSIQRFVTEASSSSDVATRAVQLFRYAVESTRSDDAVTVPTPPPVVVPAGTGAMGGGRRDDSLRHLLNAAQAAMVARTIWDREHPNWVPSRPRRFAVATVEHTMSVDVATAATSAPPDEDAWLYGLIDSDEDLLLVA